MSGFNLADLFELVVDAAPDREAIVSPARRLNYRQLDERANRLAHVLADLGVGSGDHVGLQLLNGSEYLEGMLAAVPGGPRGFCHACFSGDYPTAPPADTDKLRFGCGC